MWFVCKFEIDTIFVNKNYIKQVIPGSAESVECFLVSSFSYHVQLLYYYSLKSVNLLYAYF